MTDVIDLGERLRAAGRYGDLTSCSQTNRYSPGPISMRLDNKAQPIICQSNAEIAPARFATSVDRAQLPGDSPDVS